MSDKVIADVSDVEYGYYINNNLKRDIMKKVFLYKVLVEPDFCTPLIEELYDYVK